MRITECGTYPQMSLRGSEILRGVLSENPQALICFATGESPRGMYRLLADDPEFRPADLRALGLDEWHGLPRDHPATCRHFLQQEVFLPWGIPPARQFTFHADAPDPAAECRRMAELLDREGPMDLCILGLGRNGHLGLNEPADQLRPHAHVAELAPLSRSHRMLADQAVRVEKGMTFGIRDLLTSRRILLLVTGSGKQEVCHEFLHGAVRPGLPATLLRTHGDVDVLLDRSSLQPPESP